MTDTPVAPGTGPTTLGTLLALVCSIDPSAVVDAVDDTHTVVFQSQGGRVLTVVHSPALTTITLGVGDHPARTTGPRTIEFGPLVPYVAVVGVLTAL